MYYFYEDQENCTVYYKIQRLKWSLCCSYFFLTEIVEWTLVPRLYRKLMKKGRKPTFIEWLGKHPRWWSTKQVFPKGTRFNLDSTSDFSDVCQAKITWGFLFNQK